VRQAAWLVAGFGILVRMISIGAPHTGQVIVARFFSLRTKILSGLTLSTLCKKRMSFLLHGWRKP